MVRVRPPGGLRAAGVAVSGASGYSVDESRALIRLTPGAGQMDITVAY